MASLPPAAAEPRLHRRDEAAALLHRLRIRWVLAVLLRGSLWSAAAAAAAALLLLAADLLVPMPAAARAGLRWAPLLLLAAGLALVLLRAARPPGATRLALLVQEREPRLENQLLTLLAFPADRPGGAVIAAFRRDAAHRLRRVDPRVVLPLRVRRPALVVAGLAVVFTLAAAFWPAVANAVWDRWREPAEPNPLRSNEALAAALPAPAPAFPVVGLGDLRWRVEPPSYSGLPERAWSPGAPAAVLPGTRVAVRGPLPDAPTTVRAAVVGGEALSVRRGKRDWQAVWTAAPGDRGLLFSAVRGTDTVARRIVPVAATVDQPPRVTLHAPAADVVLAAPRGSISIQATARDDYGVGTFYLGWTRSGGSGESFSFAEGRRGWDRVTRADGVLSGSLSLDVAAIGAEPGDLLHVRAVARDRNTVGGPGEGVSETRIIRIAQPDEMHTVTTLVGAPAELEKNPVLSQRMLILLTERLRDQLRRMPRAEAEAEAAEIAHEQGRLRARVGEQIFARSTGAIQAAGAEFGFEDRSDHHGGDAEHAEPADVLEAASEATGTGTAEELGHTHDEAPIVAVNQPLLNAYNAMWAAERALNLTDPADALPHQYEALRWLQAAQQGERLFSRAQPRTPPVDVAAARGTGKLDEVRPGSRGSAAPVTSAAAYLPELERIAVLLQTGRGADAALSRLAARVLADPHADARGADRLVRAAEAARGGDLAGARGELRRARLLLVRAPPAGSAAPLPLAVDAADAEYFRRLGPRRE